MELSVIVPVYNMAANDKLSHCLESLCAQTVFADETRMEIIAVDDCSTDNSLDILDQYAERFPERFRVIHSPVNLHQGGAKNIGLTMARGEWIGFIDADDWVTPDFYEKLMALAKAQGADMAGCDYNLVDHYTFTVGQVVHNNLTEQAGVIDEDKRRSLLLDSGSLVVKIYRRHIIFGDTPVEPKEVLTAQDISGRVKVFPENIFYEDNAVGALFMLRARSFAYLSEPMYYYLQHTSSTVHTVTRANLEDRCTAGRELLRLVEKEGGLERYRDEIEYLFTVLFFINTLFSAMPRTGPIKGRYGFTKRLGEEMRATFPDFENNPYYQEKTDAEQKRLIRMQGTSHLRFYCYYTLLWTYRRLFR